MNATYSILEHLAVLLISGSGLAVILTKSSIMGPLRAWLSDHQGDSRKMRFAAEITQCLQCSGFWTGVVCELMLSTSSNVSHFSYVIIPFDLILAGASVSLCTYIIDCWQGST